MSSRLPITLTLLLASAWSAYTRSITPKPLVFNFAMNVGGQGTNKDGYAKAPLLQGLPPPNLSSWHSDGSHLANKLKPVSVVGDELTPPIHKRSIQTTRATVTQKTHHSTSSSGLPQSNDDDSGLKFRDDCPFRMNFCLYVSNCDPLRQECAMNMDCTDTVCVDKIKFPLQLTTSPLPPTSTVGAATTTTSTKTSENLDISTDARVESKTRSMGKELMSEATGFRDDCPEDKDLCVDYSAACLPHQRCVMDRDCHRILCIDRDFSTHLATEPLTITEGNKICAINSYHPCVHGHCDDAGIACVCDEGWQETFCNMPCTLKCVHGSCYIDRPEPGFLHPEKVTEDKHMKCNCMSGWTGQFCEEEIPDFIEEARQRTIKIGISLGLAFVVVIFMSVLMLIVMWRKRVIIVMKLVYFFKLREDGDGRSYDAYISMGSSTSGMEFVKTELVPTLEGFGFHVYVQARNQLIGEVQTESILKAMEKSRRTILIITQDYIRNAWSHFECTIAHIETLKLQQRIIPIVLEDISEEEQNMNKTLKHILSSVKCIKFPTAKAPPNASVKKLEALRHKEEPKFWKRLELTMPKKRRKASDSVDTDSSELDMKNTESETSELHVKNMRLEISDFDVVNNIKPINIKSIDMYTV